MAAILEDAGRAKTVFQLGSVTAVVGIIVGVLQYVQGQTVERQLAAFRSEMRPEMAAAVQAERLERARLEAQLQRELAAAMVRTDIELERLRQQQAELMRVLAGKVDTATRLDMKQNLDRDIERLDGRLQRLEESVYHYDDEGPR